MIGEQGLKNFGNGLYVVANLESTLATAINNVPGFAEYYARKTRRKDVLGVRFQSGILDMVVNLDEPCVFCVLGYSDSMGGESITAKLFKDGKEYTCTTTYDIEDIILNYQGILSVELPHLQDNLAEMVLGLYEKQVHFDILID